MLCETLGRFSNGKGGKASKEKNRDTSIVRGGGDK